MCGFIGCFGAVSSPERLTRALHSLAARGPDDEGCYQDAASWIGFRRLSILDLSLAGHQPMVFGNGRHVLAFNGEIYNHRELRTRLLAGVEHRSSGDTEVLGQLLERLPVEQVLAELRGMYAFLWYDTREQVLVAARDRYGIKPLYFHAAEGRLALASELRALLELEVARDLDPSGLLDYLAVGSVQSPSSILREVINVPPGHRLQWSQAHGIKMEPWYRPSWQAKPAWMKGGMPAWREAVRKTVFASIQAHLESDVEIGVFLSGGLDSSLVASVMRHLGHGKLKAFSIGYEQDAGVPDESSIAARTADYLGAKFECEVITSADVLAGFDSYIQAMDQPTGDALNTYLVSRVAARSVKVAMSGVGVDEWFGGYTYHRALQAAWSAGLMRPGLNKVMPTMARLLCPKGLGRLHPIFLKASHLAGLLQAPDLIGIHTLARSFFRRDDFTDSQQLGGLAAWRGAFTPDELRQDAPGSMRHQLFALETSTFLQNTLLRDCDWSSMAHSLELRTPFVDQEVFELAAHLPPEAKLTCRSSKRVMRECFQDILPPWILDDRKKKTFTLPKMKWMREKAWAERIQDTLRSARWQDRGFMSRRATALALNDFYSTATAGDSGFLRSQKVWLLFVLEEWLRAHIDNP